MGYKCTMCEEEYDDENDLSMHLMFSECLCDDSIDGVYECIICNKKYEDDGDLGMHLMYGHKLCKLTGNDAEEYDTWLNNPEFDKFRKKIDDNHTTD